MASKYVLQETFPKLKKLNCFQAFFSIEIINKAQDEWNSIGLIFTLNKTDFNGAVFVFMPYWVHIFFCHFPTPYWPEK